PRVSASTVPSTASATTTAITISVPRGTTSVSGARRTGLGGRSGGVITGHPELRPPEPDFVPCPVPPACRPAPAPEAADPGEDGAGGAGEADAAGAADAVEAAAGVPDPRGPGTVPEPEAAVSPAVLARAARAAPAAPAAAAILRTELNAPRSRSPASSPRCPWPRPAGCSGSGTTFVASAGSGSSLRGSGAWMTEFSIARAPASSSRWAGSLVSSPWMTSRSGPAFFGSSSGSVITAVSVAIADPLSYGG